MASADEDAAGYGALRRRMVEEQIAARGVRDLRVLQAMAEVPRHLFVDEAQRGRAYEDWPLPIGHGQTISQPYMVAVMTEYLELRGEERVLEVGTGSGYQAAVLGRLAREVFTLERIGPLAEAATTRLRDLGYANVRVLVGNGARGLPEHAAFDRVLVTAACPILPPALVAQLAEGGIIVAPVGEAWSGQTLRVGRKVGSRLATRDVLGCIFVPLVETEERAA
jgi:protein-L-isoaspartate(D-aspartate) O-methyltransferase